MIEKLTTGPLRGFCQTEAVHVVLSKLSAEAPGGRECPACAVHPLGEGGPSASHMESIVPSRRGDGSSHRDNDCTGMGLMADQVVNPSLLVLGGAVPHVVQLRTPVGNLSGGDGHNVGTRTIVRNPRSESLQGSGALVSGPSKQQQQRGKVALYGKCAPPRGTLPIGAKASQKLGRHWHAGEAKGRSVGQLVKEMTSGEDLGEDVEGFLGGSAEGTGNEADTLIEHKLSLGAKGAVLA